MMFYESKVLPVEPQVLLLFRKEKVAEKTPGPMLPLEKKGPH